MSSWKRVPDDEELLLARKELRFSFPEGEYVVVWEPSLQNSLTVEFGGKQEHWSLSTKEIDGQNSKLCGLADWVPELLPDVCWFELLISERPSITYWGDRVVVRQDVLKQAYS